jgi:hypothetical protein
MLFAALAACFCLLISLPVQADLYWESEQVTANVPGQENRTRMVKNYISEEASRTDMGDQTSIIKYEDMTMYQLNPKDKTYTKIDMRKLGLPGGGADMDPEKTAQAQAMIKEMFGKMQVVPTEETKTIAGYKCRKYDVNFMMVSTEYWTSKDVKGYKEITAVSKKMKKAFEDNPILKNLDLMGIMDSLEGFPVQIVNKMMGGTSTTTLKKIEKKPLPKQIFEIPEDYKLVEKKKKAPGRAPMRMPPPPPPPPGS